MPTGCGVRPSLFLSDALTRLIPQKSIYHVRELREIIERDRRQSHGLFIAVCLICRSSSVRRDINSARQPASPWILRITRVHLRFHVNESMCFPRGPVVASYFVISRFCPTARRCLHLASSRAHITSRASPVSQAATRVYTFPLAAEVTPDDDSADLLRIVLREMSRRVPLPSHGRYQHQFPGNVARVRVMIFYSLYYNRKLYIFSLWLVNF